MAVTKVAYARITHDKKTVRVRGAHDPSRSPRDELEREVSPVTHPNGS